MCYIKLIALLQVNQQDQQLYRDFSSFGSVHDSAASKYSRLNYNELLEKLLKYERALHVHERLTCEDIDLQRGDNTDIFNVEIENCILVAKGDEDAKLLKV